MMSWVCSAPPRCIRRVLRSDAFCFRMVMVEDRRENEKESSAVVVAAFLDDEGVTAVVDEEEGWRWVPWNVEYEDRESPWAGPLARASTRKDPRVLGERFMVQ